MLKKRIKDLDMKYIFKIILFSVFISLIYNFFREDGIPLIRKKEIVNYVEDELLEDSSKVTNIELKYVSYNQINKLYNDNTTIVIDARDPWEFNEGHIPGAINIPGYNVEVYKEQLSKLDLNKNIIVYCSEQDCHLSKNVAEYLIELGHTNIFVFLEGWDKWITEGGIIERGGVDEIFDEE